MASKKSKGKPSHGPHDRGSRRSMDGVNDNFIMPSYFHSSHPIEHGYGMYPDGYGMHPDGYGMYPDGYGMYPDGCQFLMVPLQHQYGGAASDYGGYRNDIYYAQELAETERYMQACRAYEERFGTNILNGGREHMNDIGERRAHLSTRQRAQASSCYEEVYNGVGKNSYGRASTLRQHPRSVGVGTSDRVVAEDRSILGSSYSQSMGQKRHYGEVSGNTRDTSGQRSSVSAYSSSSKHASYSSASSSPGNSKQQYGAMRGTSRHDDHVDTYGRSVAAPSRHGQYGSDRAVGYNKPMDSVQSRRIYRKRRSSPSESSDGFYDGRSTQRNECIPKRYDSNKNLGPVQPHVRQREFIKNTGMQMGNELISQTVPTKTYSSNRSQDPDSYEHGKKRKHARPDGRRLSRRSESPKKRVPYPAALRRKKKYVAAAAKKKIGGRHRRYSSSSSSESGSSDSAPSSSSASESGSSSSSGANRASSKRQTFFQASKRLRSTYVKAGGYAYASMKKKPKPPASPSKSEEEGELTNSPGQSRGQLRNEEPKYGEESGKESAGKESAGKESGKDSVE